MVKKTQKQEENWKDKYLRALADYQNLEKRAYNEIETKRKEANKRLLIKLLEIYDNIERAEIFVNDNGLKLIKEQFSKLLKEEGVYEMDILGKSYDPHLAECIEIVGGEQDNIIWEIVNKGYMLYDKILRIAKVKVSKKLLIK